jgi:hypothetical protein
MHSVVCNGVYRQNTSRGYANLISRLATGHPDYQTEYDAIKGQGPMDFFVRASEKARRLYRWISFVVIIEMLMKCNL